MGYFLLAVLIVLLFFSVTGLYAAFSIAHIKLKPDYDIHDYEFKMHEPEYAKKIREWVEELELKYFNIRSPYFYELNAMEIKKAYSDRWVILLHGVTSNHKSMLSYAYEYNKLGYNILLFDSRRHGKSEGKSVSYGYYEKNDLKAVVDYLRKEYGNKIKIGLHGVSMGSGILLSYACGVRDDCDFYIADCPYSNFKVQASNVIKKKIRMSGFLLKVIMLFTQIFIRLLFGYDISKIDIAGRIHRMENPVLFINCRDDDYIDPAMTAELFEKCGSEVKEIKWFDNGGHAGAFSNNSNGYFKAINEFLSRIEF